MFKIGNVTGGEDSGFFRLNFSFEALSSALVMRGIFLSCYSRDASRMVRRESHILIFWRRDKRSQVG